jgi:TonB family protein
MPEADYPPEAAERREQGDTYLELSLGDDGGVKDGRVVYSSGYSDLDDKALAVLKNAPSALTGKPAGSQTVLIRWKQPAQQSKDRGNFETLVIYASRM